MEENQHKGNGGETNKPKKKTCEKGWTHAYRNQNGHAALADEEGLGLGIVKRQPCGDRPQCPAAYFNVCFQLAVKPWGSVSVHV